jgi:hypothetical protein
MRRLIARALVLTLLLIVALGMPAQARGGRGSHHGGHHGGHRHHVHGRVVVGVGPWWWGPAYPYWYYPPPYYAYPPPYYSTPNVVIDEPPVYIQGPAAQAPASQAPGTPSGYWYYCPSTQAYYPDVPTCQEPWVQVSPRSE